MRGASILPAAGQRSRAMDLAAFLFGLGAVTQTRVIGALALTEIVLAVLAPVLLMRQWRRLRQTHAITILALGLLWLASALLTDYYREVAPNDMIKGSFAIVLLLTTFIGAFAILAPDLRRVRWMALGFAVSAVISVFVFRSQALLGRAQASGVEPEALINFKTVYAYVLFWVLLGFVALCDERWPRVTAGVVLASAFAFLLGGLRSIFLVVGLSGAAMAVGQSLPSLARFARQSQIATGIAAAIAIWGASSLYGAVVERGWMGAEEQVKYESQSRSELGLLAGRAEFLSSLAAVADSPLLGHGSWARDRKGYGFRLVTATGGGRRDILLRAASISAGTALIPCHSHLLQGWVWHGLAGGLFWMVVGGIVVIYVRRALGVLRPVRGYALLLMLMAGWDILFSPFAFRPRWAVVFCICVLSLAHLRRIAANERAGGRRGGAWDGTWEQGAEEA